MSPLRLAEVDKAFQQWILLRIEELVHAWRHARAWLMLCERAKARVKYRRAGFRGLNSATLDYFTPVPGAAAPAGRGRSRRTGIMVRCRCCMDGTQLIVSSPMPLWNHLLHAYHALYVQPRSRRDLTE